MSDQQLVTENYAAIIDIGSNAVRLVIYDGLNRAPLKIYSERVICNLGSDLATTGYLNVDSVKKALDSIRRFSALLNAMKIKNIRAVATAAVRDARDGYKFVNTVQQEFGLKMTVIDGEEEARLSAQGVLAGGLGGHGVIGDYGGGSLELIAVEGGVVQHKASLPLGSHRLLAETSRAARSKMIERHLSEVGFLEDYTGLDFYAMGGAWRSMATAHMHMSKYPLWVLDCYRIEGEDATDFAGVIARQNPATLEQTTGMSRRRLKDMSVAALAMEHLFKKIQPSALVFSGTGLREGLLFDQLTPAVQKQDPLIEVCKKMAAKMGRWHNLDTLKKLFAWLHPLCQGQDAAFARLLEASCLLSDISWIEHEDYQAAHAYQRILVLPFYGIDHAGRAFLALSQYVRYKGYWRKEANDITAPAQKLLGAPLCHLAITAGLAQSLAYLLTGGSLQLLNHASLDITARQVTLTLNKKAAAFSTEPIVETMNRLAESMGKKAVIKTAD